MRHPVDTIDMEFVSYVKSISSELIAFYKLGDLPATAVDVVSFTALYRFGRIAIVRVLWR